jgi:hypothetical protein
MKIEEKKRRMQEMKNGSLTDHVVVGVTDIRLYASERENGVLVPYLSVFLDICGIFVMDSPSKKSKLEDIIKGLRLIAEEDKETINETKSPIKEEEDAYQIDSITGEESLIASYPFKKEIKKNVQDVER